MFVQNVDDELKEKLMVKINDLMVRNNQIDAGINFLGVTLVPCKEILY